MTGEITMIIGILTTATIAIVQSFKLMKLREQYQSKVEDYESLNYTYKASEHLRKNRIETRFKYYKARLKETELERDEYFNLLKQVDKNKIVTIHRPYKRSQTRYTLAGQYIDEKLGENWEEAE